MAELKCLENWICYETLKKAETFPIRSQVPEQTVIVRTVSDLNAITFPYHSMHLLSLFCLEHYSELGEIVFMRNGEIVDKAVRFNDEIVDLVTCIDLKHFDTAILWCVSYCAFAVTILIVLVMYVLFYITYCLLS